MTVKIEGIQALYKALKDEYGKEAPKLIAKQHKRIAQLVVPLAKQKANARPRDDRGGHVARTIRARGSGTKASIAAGGKRAEDIFVQEFGGKIPYFGDASRKYLVRDRKKKGYFIYPAIAEKSDAIERIYAEAMAQAIRRYFDE